MAMTARHLAKRAPIVAYSARRSRSPSRPSVTCSPAKPASGLAPVSTLIPATMPARVSASTNDRPASVFCRIVSSYRIAPLMHVPRRGVVTIRSRYWRRISAVCGMSSLAKRLLHVAVLSSIASRPRSPATSAAAVSTRRFVLMAALGASCATLAAMPVISACHDLAKAAAPSRCSRSASASSSIPAARSSAITVSASPPSAGIAPADLAVIGECFQRLLGDRVDGVGRGERFEIQRVGSGRILDAGARPEQPLRMRSGGGELSPTRPDEQLAIGLVGASGDGDAEAIALLRRELGVRRDVPAAHEQRRHRLDLRIEPGGDAPLDAAQVGLGGGAVVLAREQQRDVDRHAGEDRFLDRRNARRRARNLDVEIGPVGGGMQAPRGLDRPPRCRRRGAARPRARPSRRRRHWRGGSAGTGRRRASGPAARGRRTAPRPICLAEPDRRSARRRTRRRRSPARRSSGSMSAR